MRYRRYLPPFGRIFLASLILFLLGGGGLLFIFLFMEPTLGPRWLFFFFLTSLSSGIALPIVYIIQRRLAKEFVPPNVLIREALFFAIFIDLAAWLQLGRIITNLIIFILAVGFILLEIFLRMAERATFKPDEASYE